MIRVLIVVTMALLVQASECSAQLTNYRYDTGNGATGAGHNLTHNLVDLGTAAIVLIQSDWDNYFATAGGTDIGATGGTSETMLVMELAQANTASNMYRWDPQTSASLGRMSTSITDPDNGEIYWSNDSQFAAGWTSYEIENLGSSAGTLDIQLFTLVASDIDTFNEINASSNEGPGGYGDYTYFCVGDSKLDEEGNPIPGESTWIYGNWTGTSWHIWWQLEQIGDVPDFGDIEVPDIADAEFSYGQRPIEAGDRHRQWAYIYMSRGNPDWPKVSFGQEYTESTGIDINVRTEAND